MNLCDKKLVTALEERLPTNGQKLCQLDIFNFYLSQFLAMARAFLVSFLGLLAENNELGAFEMPDDPGGNFGRGRLGDRGAFFFLRGRLQSFEGHFRALFVREFFNLQNFTRDYPVLLAACFDYCVHSMYMLSKKSRVGK